MSMKLSIAMCTYNGARHLQEQLNSIARQTRLPDELVVCDDGSSDGTPEAVRKFAAGAPFVVRLYVNEKNLGSTRNFEKAISLCEGDVIALSDQDDVWLPEKLQRFEAEFAASPEVGLVFSDALVVDESLRPLDYTLWQSLEFTPQWQKRLTQGHAFQVLLENFYVTGATMAFRSRLRELALPIHATSLRRFGKKPMEFIHDAWIALMAAAAAELVPISEALIKYRQHSAQQLGMPPPEARAQKDARKPAASWAARADTSYDEYFACELSFLEEIYARLERSCDSHRCKATMAYLKPKIYHLRARAHLPANKLRRLPLVLRELITFRYSRYSNGALSAAKDLLFQRRRLAPPPQPSSE